jgi:hypothetical protein
MRHALHPELSLCQFADALEQDVGRFNHCEPQQWILTLLSMEKQDKFRLIMTQQ